MKSKTHKLPLKSLLMTLGLGVVINVVLFNCTSSKPKSDQLADSLDEEEKKKFDEYRAEIEIGRNMSGRLLQFYGVYNNKELVDYVNQVGVYVAQYSTYPDRKYMFQVLDSDIVNAFAAPGGYILISLGAIRHCKNEAQLAHLLGHEITHVGNKHMFNTLKTMSKEDLEKAAEESQKKKNLPPEDQARKRPEPEESAAGALLARYLSGSTGINILAAAKAGMSLILEQGLKPELEIEADSFGTRYAINAGYDPRAFVDWLCRLDHDAKVKNKRCEFGDKTSKKKPQTILESTHPPISERVENIEKILTKLDASAMVGAVGKARFKKIAKKIRPLKEK